MSHDSELPMVMGLILTILYFYKSMFYPYYYHYSFFFTYAIGATGKACWIPLSFYFYFFTYFMQLFPIPHLYQYTQFIYIWLLINKVCTVYYTHSNLCLFNLPHHLSDYATLSPNLKYVIYIMSFNNIYIKCSRIYSFRNNVTKWLKLTNNWKAWKM